MPPPLAVFEGVAGEKKRSAAERVYASFSELCPKRLIKIKEMRRPRPVFVNPLASKKAPTQVHTAVLEKPTSESPIFPIPNRLETHIDNKVKADNGIGTKIRPATVEAKTAKPFHASGVRPAGTGNNHMTAPMPIVISHLVTLFKKIPS